MLTTYQKLRDAIRDKLLGISDFKECHRFPKLMFNGFPAVAVEPADLESDWETNSELERTYSFNLHIYYETKVSGNDTALDKLYNIIDTVLDAFDEDQTLTDESLSLPAGNSILTINPSNQGWEGLSDNELIHAQVLLTIKISTDIS